jgi:hypothetical protein
MTVDNSRIRAQGRQQLAAQSTQPRRLILLVLMSSDSLNNGVLDFFNA